VEKCGAGCSTFVAIESDPSQAPRTQFCAESRSKRATELTERFKRIRIKLLIRVVPVRAALGGGPQNPVLKSEICVTCLVSHKYARPVQSRTVVALPPTVGGVGG
jgi:hypothetical protein